MANWLKPASINRGYSGEVSVECDRYGRPEDMTNAAYACWLTLGQFRVPLLSQGV